MDAYHLLLGRPWLYDNHVIYNGYANTYSLKHNEKNITLAPLPPPEPHKAKSGKESEKIPRKSETREECATSKSKRRITLLMVNLNTSEGVEPLPLVARHEHKSIHPQGPIAHENGDDRRPT